MRTDNPFATPAPSAQQLAPSAPSLPGERSIFPSPMAAMSAPFGPDENSLDVARAFAAAAHTPLLASAAQLTWLAGRFASFTPRDVGALRDCLAAEIRRIGTHSELDVGTRAAACYALAATFDDLALNAAWSGGDAWARNTLVSLMFNEACGGERFFDLLAQLEREPKQNADKLTLMSLCLALGFQGKFRILPNGAAQLALIRANLSRLLEETADIRGTRLLARALPVDAPHRAPQLSRTVFAIAITLSVAVLGASVVMTLALKSRVEAAAAKAALLIPNSAPKPRAAEAPQQVPLLHSRQMSKVEAKVPAPETTSARLRRMLASEIAEGRVSIVDQPDFVIVRLIDGRLFASASTTLSATGGQLLGAVATVLQGMPAAITVIGHTDSQPIHTPQIGSNAILAMRRAEAVAGALRARLPPATTIHPESRGDREPLASNSTPEGRAHNRRVEILVPTSASFPVAPHEDRVP
ncbi:MULTISPECIES: type IVB secretion system protein IcmH/DotU [unclassified Chelatococcus]|uniref:type IVB secretion system protein IcmH/DotU n=1 Tax=unclassified Chelatococcus TaxID=2638111 RepID=UPI001BCB52DF|nr:MULTISPECIES: type IVB secretion system protein IcmH/DotU [unclassified Chelatococcus]MBS7697289.1 type IVB secretion system protein IcmH/DotU [Chelatococcus sp. YT9]MBX3556414.1 type IVB secretion system protein IcmH/DotU [Chelatococcus sp.]